MSALKPGETPSHSGLPLRDADLFGADAETSLAPEGLLSAGVAEFLTLPQSRGHSRLRGVTGTSDPGAESDHSSISEAASLANPPYNYKNALRRPSPWWILIITAFSSIVSSMTLAPKTEVYIRLVCLQYKPEFFPPPAHPPAPEYLPLPLDLRGTSYFPKMHESPVFIESPDFLVTNVRVHVPRPSSKCTSDPEVGRIVAGLNTAVALTLGIFSLVTTGYWASYSDRVGRRRVLGVSAMAGLLMDASFVISTLHANKIPGGYNLFILCSLIHGLAGGIVTYIAAAQSYCSDCADPTSRARLFSIFYGMWFAGVALGPTIGGFLITATNDMLSVFYAAIVGHMISSALVWFVLPESVSSELRAANNSSHAAAKLANHEEGRLAPTGLNGIVRRTLSSLFNFLIPLRVFVPRKREVGEPGYPHGSSDWNLTFIGLSSGVSFTIIGILPLKFQYAEAAFDWNSETIGYFLGGVGTTRAIHLAVFLPLIIRIFGPKRGQLHNSHCADQNDPSHPLLDEYRSPNPQEAPGQSQRRSVSPTPTHSQRIIQRHGHHSAHFDLMVARVSLIVDLTAYTLVSLSATGPQLFAFSMISSFGSGFNPSVQALALYLMPHGGKDAGKLFGAIGMLGALSTQVIGPSLFGLTYMATVATFPKAIFVVGAVALLSAFVALSFVRLPRQTFEPVNAQIST